VSSILDGKTNPQELVMICLTSAEKFRTRVVPQVNRLIDDYKNTTARENGAKMF
jgi:hypothetical protein